MEGGHIYRKNLNRLTMWGGSVFNQIWPKMTSKLLPRSTAHAHRVYLIAVIWLCWAQCLFMCRTIVIVRHINESTNTGRNRERDNCDTRLSDIMMTRLWYPTKNAKNQLFFWLNTAKKSLKKNAAIIGLFVLTIAAFWIIVHLYPHQVHFPRYPHPISLSMVDNYPPSGQLSLMC